MNKSELFSSLEQRYGLPEGYLARTETLESDGGRLTYNKNSGAAGNFQFLPKYQKAYGITDPYDLRQSAEAAAKLAANNRAALQQKGIENPTAADLYAAHQQGATGYVDLLKAGDKPASSVVGEKAVVWNGGKADMTAFDFANKITSKFSGNAAPPQPQQGGQTATGIFAKPGVDVAESPEQTAALEGQAPLSTQDVLDTANAASEGGRRQGNGLKELGFLHNYFKSLDTSATGVKPLTVPNFFNQPKYKHGGIVSLKEDAKRVRAAGIGGDTVLAHITASEAALLKSMGGSGRINPRTGLPMFEEEGEGGNNNSNAPGTNSNTSNGQEQGPGLGLNDSFGAQPGEQGPSMGEMNFGGSSLSNALGNTSMGSFGLNGITSEISTPGTSTPASGKGMDPGATPGYEGPGTSVQGAVFDGLAPTIDLGPDFSSANSPLADPGVTSLSYDKVGALTNAAVTYDPASLSTATQKAVDKALAELTEAPAAIGVNPSTTPTSTVSPSTPASSTPASSTPASSSAKSSGPTASSSTTKGKGYDITGFDFIDSKISSMINNPTATIAGLAVSAVNPVAGFANALTGNQIGMLADRAISSMLGTQPGPGNTVTSEEPGTNPASPSTPSGPGPSIGDETFGDGSSGGNATYNPVSPATSSSSTSTAPVRYDVSKFLGELGESSYTTPASVYSSYPVQQGIGSIAAPQYTGSFYNPSFGKVPYQ
jgi:hypothetical protein